MTRFARAKGSKASNERVPEKPTSWSEMKQQLLEKNKEAETSKQRQAAFDEKRANYKAFLNEKEMQEASTSKWADFPEVSRNENKKVKNKNNKSKQGNTENDIERNKRNQGEQQNAQKSNGLASVSSKTKKRKLDGQEPKIKKPRFNLDGSDDTITNQVVDNINKKKSKKSIKENTVKNDIKKVEINEQTSSNNLVKSNVKESPFHSNKTKTEISNDGKKQKVKKSESVSNNLMKPRNNQKQKKVNKDNLTDEDFKKIEKKKQKKIKQLQKKKKFKQQLAGEQQNKQIEDDSGQTHSTIANSNQYSNSNQIDNTNSSHFKPNRKFKDKEYSNKINKKQKVRDNQEHPRRKPLLPHKMFINGKEIEVAYVDSFPVKKEDAERLKKLRKEMISKGIPRSQINVALKLERRKAEKAFTREKKKVCFNCRKSGHNLSECPELNKNEVAETTGTGICFKCGSTEHTHFQCRVVKGQEFKFAQCFICNEQGHIARQCPDNARGLYPKGGACKVCGDVTHLKKDCPTYQSQQEKVENSLQISTMNNSNPDIMDEDNSSKMSTGKRTNKIIKFT